MSQPRSYERLIALVTDRQLAEPTPDEVRELQGLLQSSSRARRLYIELVNLQGHLETLLTRRTTEDVVHDLDTDEIFAILRQAEDAAPDVAAPWQVSELHLGHVSDESPALTLSDTASAVSYLVRQQVKRHRVFLGGVAALLVIGAVLALSFLGGPDEPNQPEPLAVTPQDDPAAVAAALVATLTAVTDAQWRAESGATLPGVGDKLHAGQRLTLVDGFAEITTEEGAVVILEAPATIKLLDSNNAIRLHAGKMVGICETESSKGFLVRTPHMDIIDLGTRFGVDASARSATEVHVIEGSVQAVRTNAGSAEIEPMLLAVGDAVRASEQDDAMVVIESDAPRFASIRLSDSTLLGGTGLSLVAGDKDPNWQVVAIGGDPLDEPVLMDVTTRLSNTQRLADAVPGVQYLRLHDALVADINSYINDKRIRYTVRSTLVLPKDFDPSRDSLAMQFEADDRLLSVRLNSQEHAAPPNQYQHDKNEFYRMAIPSENLRPGPNTVELEIEDLIRSNNYVWGFGIAWQLEALAKPTP